MLRKCDIIPIGLWSLLDEQSLMSACFWPSLPCAAGRVGVPLGFEILDGALV